MEAAVKWRAVLVFFGFSVYLYMDKLYEIDTQKQSRDQNHRFSSNALFTFVPPKDVQTKSKYFELPPKEDIGARWRRERNKWESKLDKHEYPYLINPKRKCADIGEDEKPRNITLLILVKSAPGNSKLRDAVRSTYMHGIVKYNLSCKVIFLLGFPKGNKAKQQEIIEESMTHGDILQEDFVDSYFNLTIKLIMGFKWASNFCTNSHFVMSTDDDVMIDIVYLLKDLENVALQERSNFVLGKRILDGRPIRDKSNKWYTPKEVYPGEMYPPFSLGHGYIVSQDVGRRAYDTSLKVPPPVPWDDVYFGMLLQKLGGIKILSRNSWYMYMRTVHRKGKDAPQFDYLKIELSIEQMFQTWKSVDSEGR